MNKRRLLLVLSLSIAFLSNGQVDTLKIYNCKQLKRGFYKNYEEYINNSPSDTQAFKTSPYRRSKSDSSIIAARYTLLDSSKTINGVWGFCDGRNVFVKYATSPVKKYFWKLDYIGVVPFFSYKQTHLGDFDFSVISFVSSNDIAMLIDQKGKFQQFDIATTRKILKDQPDLLNSFKAATVKYDDIDPNDPETHEAYVEKVGLIRSFLIKFNEQYKGNTNPQPTPAGNL